MTIKTIFREGDEVWVMINNKPIKTKIVDAEFKSNYGESKLTLEERLQWRLEVEEIISGLHKYRATRPESELFLTKEELIKSL